MVRLSVIVLISVLSVPGFGLNTQPARERLDSADLVVSGKVILIKKERANSSVSEHSPNWHNAVVEVEEVLKGQLNLVLLIVRFPKSVDVAWFDAPKFFLGQKGVFILHKDDEDGAFTALDPLDFQPKKR